MAKSAKKATKKPAKKFNKDKHNAAVSKAKTAKRKRPTLEEALKNRGIKSIAKSKKKPAKKKAAPKKKRHASPLTNPKQAALDREKKAIANKKKGKK